MAAFRPALSFQLYPRIVGLCASRICRKSTSTATMIDMHFQRIRFGRVAAHACALLCLMASSQSDTRPLPEDTGAVHLYQLLAKLRTTARIMHTVAHPDDEDGGMLTMEAR